MGNHNPEHNSRYSGCAAVKESRVSEGVVVVYEVPKGQRVKV